MQISIADVLSPSVVAEARRVLTGALFVDGRETAGGGAKLVKDNLQAAPDPTIGALRDRLRERVRTNPVFDQAARPKAFAGTLFSRYMPGHAYGAHVDNALMNGFREEIGSRRDARIFR